MTLVHPEGRSTIRKMFQSFFDNKLKVVANGMENLQGFLQHENQTVHLAAVNGMLMGLFLANACCDKELKKIFFDQYLEAHSKDIGENVVDFLDHKQKKGRY